MAGDKGKTPAQLAALTRQSPCLGCEARGVKCHTRCTAYLEYDAARKLLRKHIAKKRQVEAVLSGAGRPLKPKSRRRKR